MKKLALHNWREPDVPKTFPGLVEEIWVSEVMKPSLIESVPENVVRLFEVARGSILYGWFFYPLLTLAEQQLHRVQETAVRERCKLAGIPVTETKRGKSSSRRFVDIIRDLHVRGIIPDESKQAWDAVRSLRNTSSHPEHQTIIPPGTAIAAITATARQINQLFAANPDYFSVLGTRVRNATGLNEANRDLPTVVGIDIGNAKSGFHLVALSRNKIAGTHATKDAVGAARWCVEIGAKLVAVDAPCGWNASAERGRREAEDLLARMGYSSYPTPTREKALTTPSNDWVLNGERLYQALKVHFPLFHGSAMEYPFCFETYPYAASCAFARRKLNAGDKTTDRRDIVRSAGIDDSALKNIDLIDATICALVAYSVSIDYYTALGNPAEGFILIPPLS